VPPLRERRDDIPALVEVIAEDIATRNATGPLDLSPEAIAMLSAQAWRGNTRELRNVLEQAAMRSDSPHIEAAQVEAVLREAGVERVPPLPPAPRLPAKPDLLRPLGDQVAELERQAIAAALAATAGNKLAAAKLLGISRAKLYERLDAMPEFQTVV
jgi:DNA-binding NtrC family response regulator